MEGDPGDAGNLGYVQHSVRGVAQRDVAHLDTGIDEAVPACRDRRECGSGIFLGQRGVQLHAVSSITDAASYGFRMNSNVLFIPINGKRKEVRAPERSYIFGVVPKI